MNISKGFFLLLLIISYGNANPQIKKTTVITLLENGFAKVECTFQGKSNCSILFFSDMMKNYSNLTNIIVKVKGTQLAPQYYSASVHKFTDGYYGYIYFRKFLKISGDIDVYMSYDVKVDNNNSEDVIWINFAEEILKSEEKLDIDYKLIVKSADKNFVPSISNYQTYFKIKENSNSIFLSRSYVSKPSEGNPDGLLVQGLLFTNPSNDIISETSRTIKVINSKLVEEYFDYSLRGVKIGRIFLTIPLPEISNLNNKPEISVNVDGVELSPYKLTSDEFSKFNYGILNSPLKFLYYFGLNQHLNANLILLAFNIKEDQIGNLKIKLEYNPEKNLITEDGFNYLWKYFNFSLHNQKKTVFNYYNFQIPNEFIIDEVSIDSSIIKMGSNYISYNFINNVPRDTLNVHFTRTETHIYNLFKIINILFLIISLILIFLITINVIPLNFIKIKYKILLTIVSFFYAFIFGKLSTSNFWNGIEYTWAWVPFCIIIFLLFYSFWVEGKEINK